MIHIISRGNKHVIDCPECNCKFSFENEDIEGNQYNGSEVKCPQCNTTIYLKYEEGVFKPHQIRR